MLSKTSCISPQTNSGWVCLIGSIWKKTLIAHIVYYEHFVVMCFVLSFQSLSYITLYLAETETGGERHTPFLYGNQQVADWLWHLHSSYSLTPFNLLLIPILFTICRYCITDYNPVGQEYRTNPAYHHARGWFQNLFWWLRMMTLATSSTIYWSERVKAL